MRAVFNFHLLHTVQLKNSLSRQWCRRLSAFSHTRSSPIIHSRSLANSSYGLCRTLKPTGNLEWSINLSMLGRWEATQRGPTHAWEKHANSTENDPRPGRESGNRTVPTSTSANHCATMLPIKSKNYDIKQKLANQLACCRLSALNADATNRGNENRREGTD